MIELSLPQPEEDSRNVKDLVFTLLTQEQPLSIIELTRKIQKSHNLRVSYQAVRKAVNTLEKKSLLEKSGKEYSLSKQWLLNLKGFIDSLLLKYETGKEISTFTQEVGKENYAVYTFGNLLDLDNFWGDMQTYWLSHLKKDSEKEVVMYCHYNWWMLINLGRETKIFQQFVKKCPVYVLCFRDIPLNKWAMEIYKDLRIRTKTMEDKGTDETVGINILGDTVIQVKYSAAIIKKIKDVFEKHKNTQQIGMREITKLAHEPCEIKFIVFKNQAIAKDLRETYKKMVNG